MLRRCSLFVVLQAVLRDVEKQRGHMDDVLAEGAELKPSAPEEPAEPSKEQQLSDQLSKLRDQSAEKVKELQVMFLHLNIRSRD